MKALNALTVFSHRRAIRRRMYFRPLSHMQACVAVQWSDRLWSAQYRQRQAPLLRGRIRVGLANGGVDKHVAEIDEAVLATPAIRVDDGAWEHSSANDPL